MPIQPIGIKLNGWDIEPQNKSINSFKFNSKFRLIPREDLNPIKENPSMVKLVSPIKQLIDQTKEAEERSKSTSESTFSEINMGISSPKKRKKSKKRATRGSKKSNINMLSSSKRTHSVKRSRRGKVGGSLSKAKRRKTTK